MAASSQAWVRPGALCYAVLLGDAAFWILLPELYRTDLNALPIDPDAAARAVPLRGDASMAAQMGVIRGDLWAECAFSYGDLFSWEGADRTAENTDATDSAYRCATNAVADAPYQPSVWLLLAGLAARYHWADPTPAEAIKMSYYTGPNEAGLVPMRLLVVAQSNALDDDDVKTLVRLDVETIISRRPQLKPAIVAAYGAAPPRAKAFFEDAAARIDPAFVASMRAGKPVR
jgi:hypothetical protein